MGRMKKGEPGHDLAKDRYLKSMIKKYGSMDAYRVHMRSLGAIGGKNGHTGGFAANRELARIAGAKGGKKSSRKGVKNSPKNMVV